MVLKSVSPAAVQILEEVGLGEIPTTWRISRIEDLLSNERGISVGVMYPGNHDPLGIPLIRAADLAGNIINSHPEFQITPIKHEEYRRTELAGGELLISLVGEIGRCALVAPRMAGWNAARAIAVLRFTNPADADFVRYCLMSAPLQHLMHAWATTTVQATLNLKEIRQLPLPWPPEEQREAIVTILKSLEDKIYLNYRMNETLEAMARAIFKSWFVDFDPVRAKAEGRQPFGINAAIAALFPHSFQKSALEEIPEAWGTGPILKSAKLLSGGTPKTDREEYWGGDVAWASAKDVSQSGEAFLIKTERTITKKGLAESATQLIPQFSTVVVARGATTGRMVLFGREMAMNQTCYALASTDNAPFYLHCLAQGEINKLVHAAHGSVFDTITTATFASSQVLLPPRPIIEAFEDHAAPLFQMILSNTNESTTLAQVRDLLLPKLISGEIRIKDAEKIIGESV